MAGTRLYGPSGCPVNVTAEGKLEVEALLVGGISVVRYRPKVEFVNTDTTISGSSTETILNFTGSGQLDYIRICGDSDKFEIILEMDSVQIYSILMKDLKDRLKLDHGEGTNYYNIDDNKKVFMELYPSPVDFATNLTIKIKNNDTGNKKIKGILIRYREEI